MPGNWKNQFSNDVGGGGKRGAKCFRKFLHPVPKWKMFLNFYTTELVGEGRQELH